MESLYFFAELAYLRHSRALDMDHVIPFEELPERLQQAWLDTVQPCHATCDN